MPEPPQTINTGDGMMLPMQQWVSGREDGPRVICRSQMRGIPHSYMEWNSKDRHLFIVMNVNGPDRKIARLT